MDRKFLIVAGVAFAMIAGLLVIWISGSGDESSSNETVEVAVDPAPELEADPSYPTALPTGQLPVGVAPTHYTLNLELVPEADRFTGTVTIDLQTDVALEHFFLHAEGLDIRSAEILQGESLLGEVSINQEGKDGESRVTLPHVLAPGDYRLRVAYAAAYSTELDGIYKVTESGEAYLTSQMQTISARRAFPSFDEPRFKVPFDFEITAPSEDAVITNTPLVNSRDLEGGLTRHVFATSKPLPTYLLAFAVGPYDVVEGPEIAPFGDRSEAIPLRAIVTKGNGHKTDYILNMTEAMVHYFEEYFDEPYPYAKLDLVAVPDYAFGAMENAATIVYREQYVMIDDQTPQSTLAYSVRVHAHEIAHQWFGDLVTPRWWNDAWLNESFATWAEKKASHLVEPEWGFDVNLRDKGLDVMKKDRRASVRAVRLPIESNHDIVSAFDGIGYSKGGAVIGMFENYLGKDAFRSGVRLHMDRFNHDIADFDDFVASLAEGSGRPELVEAFNSFILQPGVPMVDFDVTCDDEGATAQVKQSRFYPLGSEGESATVWQIPVCYRTESGSSCELVTEPQTALNLGPTCPSLFVPNDAAHGYYLWTLDGDSLDKLLLGFDDLSGIEGTALAYNLRAWFDAGKISFEDLIKISKVLLASDDPLIAANTVDLWVDMYDSIIVDTPERTAFAVLLGDLVRPLSDRLGLWPSSDLDEIDPNTTAQLRREVVEAMGLVAADEEVRAQLVSMGEATIGFDGTARDPDKVNTSIREVVLAVAVEERGAAFADALIEELQVSNQGTLRDDILFALARTKDTDLTDRLLQEVVLADFVRQNESVDFADYLFDNAATRSQVWTWLTEGTHLDQIALRLPNFARRDVASLGNTVCDVAARDSYKEFMQTKFHVLDGGPRTVDEGVEIINQCIALKSNKGPEIAEYLATPMQ